MINFEEIIKIFKENKLDFEIKIFEKIKKEFENENFENIFGFSSFYLATKLGFNIQDQNARLYCTR